MLVSNNYKEKIDNEFEFVIQKMIDSKDPHQMLYYFSGLHTLMNRILNFEYSDELLFVYFVLERSYKDIVNQLATLKQGNSVVTFHDDFGAKLIEMTKELKDGLHNSKLRTEILKKIIVLSYTSTGNGYFLIEKGIIDIFSDTKQITKEK